MPNRYWIYAADRSQVVIHRSDCSWCHDGKGRDGTAPHISRDWYGFYATRGAAADAVDAMGWEIYSGSCCPESRLRPSRPTQ